MIRPLVPTAVTPNHLTTVRFFIGLAGAWAFSKGGYGWMNLGAVLLVVSNVVDHADGELARLSGKTSRFGHFYDLAADALVTVLLFGGIGAGVAATYHSAFAEYAIAAGAVTGTAVATIFFVRMRIEELEGKNRTQQPGWGGFELEDMLYLMPLVTLFQGLQSFLILAVVGAPTFAVWVILDYHRVIRRHVAILAPPPKPTSRP